MFTINDYMQRWKDLIQPQLEKPFAPPTGFDDVIVTITREEFYDLCKQEPEVFTSRRVHGVSFYVLGM